MSNLRNKSEINLDSAELLHKNYMYPSVVHCSYYSCYQLMKHIWLTSMSKTDAELRLLTSSTKEGSHEVLINQLYFYIKSRSQDFREFNNTIGQLKKLRRKADYEDVQIDFSKSKNSIDLSKSTLSILRKCL